MKLSLFSRLKPVALLSLAVASVPGTAGAVNPEMVPSIGADVGRFNLPIECDVSLSDMGDYPIARINGTVDIEGVAPAQLGRGQDLFLSQGAGQLKLPSWLATLGGLITVDSADAELDSLKIGADNAIPEVIDLANEYDLTVRDIPVEVGKPVVVGLPETGSFLVGPYASPQDGRIQFRFDGASANVTLKSALGPEIRVRADCQASEGNALLPIAVGDGIDPSVPALFENEPLDLPSIEPGYLSGVVHPAYQCMIGDEEYDVGIAVSAIIPLAVKRFGSINFEEASGAITLPPETVNRLMDAGYTSVEGQVHELNLIVDNGWMRDPNVLPEGTEIPPTPLQRDTRVTVPLPPDETLTVGPIFGSWFADSMVVGLGSASASLRFNGSDEAVEASCPEPEPEALLIDAAII